MGLLFTNLLTWAQTDIDVFEFNIQAQPLTDALIEFSLITGRQVVADADLLRNRDSSAVNGRFAPQDALVEMTQATQLVVVVVNDSNYALKLPEEPVVPPGASGPVVEQIIVYGERVERRLEETMSTISVITEEELERLAQQNLFESVIGVPNTLYTEGDGYPAIRGQQISASGSNLGSAIVSGTEPRTVIVLDGFAQPSSWANNAYNSLLDLEQIEIFRGPQSTLRGRNSNAGMIVVKTLDPTFDFRAQAMAEYSYDEAAEGAYRVGAVFNGALFEEQVAGRITLEKREGRDNVGDFQTVTVGGNSSTFRSDGDADDAANIESSFVRGKLLIRPTGDDTLTINLIGSYNEGTTPLFRNQIAGRNAGLSLNDRVPAFPTDYRVVDSQTYFFGADIDYQTQAAGAFELLLGYTNDSFDSNRRRSDSGVNFNDNENEFTTVEGLWRFGDGASKWNGIVGLSYANRTTELDALAFVVVPLAISTDTDAYSVYTDLRYNVTSRLELNVGGRYLRTDQNRDVTFVNPIIVDETLEEEVFLPQFGATYALTDSQNLAISIRRGFGDGAVSFNNATFQPYSYDPEYSWIAEASWKGTFNQGRGRFSTVAFYNDFRDQQVSVLVATVPFDVQEVRNVADSRSYGLELEGRYDITDTLTIGGSIGLIQTEIQSNAGLEDIDGNDFGFDPAYTLQLLATWRPTDRLTLDASVVDVADYFPSASNVRATKGGDYTLVNIGGAYDFGRVRGRLFVQNLFDELAFTSRFALSGGGTVLAPRTIGLTLAADF